MPNRTAPKAPPTKPKAAPKKGAAGTGTRTSVQPSRKGTTPRTGTSQKAATAKTAPKKAPAAKTATAPARTRTSAKISTARRPPAHGTGSKSRTSRTPKPKAMEVSYSGRIFRSRLEARWAVFMDLLDVNWDYEPSFYQVGEELFYLPDFYLPDHQLWLEVKGAPFMDTATMAKVLASVAGPKRIPLPRSPARAAIQGYGKDLEIFESAKYSAVASKMTARV